MGQEGPSGSRGASGVFQGARRTSRGPRGQGGFQGCPRVSRGRLGIQGGQWGCQGCPEGQGCQGCPEGQGSQGSRGPRWMYRGSQGVKGEDHRINGHIWWVVWWFVRHYRWSLGSKVKGHVLGVQAGRGGLQGVWGVNMYQGCIPRPAPAPAPKIFKTAPREKR